MDFVVAEVTFLPEEEGGRKLPPLDSANYRPHVVVGDPGQRKAIADADRVIQEEYLAVLFSGDGRQLDFGKPHEVCLQLWNPNTDYSAMAPDATFTVREGPWDCQSFGVTGLAHVVVDGRSRGPRRVSLRM